MGTKDIAVHLNSRNIMLRGQRWCRNRVHEILSSRTYIGEYYFNKRDHKTKAIKPESEWSAHAKNYRLFPQVRGYQLSYWEHLTITTKSCEHLYHIWAGSLLM